MSETDAALKHLVAPGNYQVRWILPGADSGEPTTVIGTVTLAAQAMPSSSLAFDNIPLAWDTNGATFPQSYHYDLLQGTLATNQDIVLLDAVIETWFPGRAHVSARSAIVGLLNGTFTGDVIGIQFQTTFLDRLRDSAPISAFSIPQLSGDGPVEWKVIQAEHLAHSWSSDDASMRLEYIGSAGVADPYEMHLRYSALATVELGQPSTLDDVINDWLVPAQALASLAVGKRADVTFAAVGVPNGQGKPQWMQLYGGGLTQAPFNAARYRPSDPKPVLRFGASSHSMLDMLLAWQSKQNDGEPLFQTYVSVLGVPNDHPRNRMLLLAQAIEGHHGSVHKQQHEQQDAQHAEKRDAHLEAVAGADLDTATKKFIKNNLAKRPLRSLNTVLDWAVGTLPGQLADRFAALDIVQAVIADPDNKATSWQDAVRIIRNDLAHGNRAYPDAPVRELTDLLDKVVRALVFASVDADPGVLANLLIAES